MSGLADTPNSGHALDPRIHVDAAHLRSLTGLARAISFRPSQPARSILNGQHASKLKGRGLNFEELRHYSVGDDIRTIDWKVTARAGEPYVRVYTEERDRPVMVLVDQRMSMFFGSVMNMKSVTAAEAAAISAFRVKAMGDRIGGIVFNDTDMVEVRPKASQRALNQFISVLAGANCALNADLPATKPMSLNTPLRAATRIAKTGGLVMMISDFDGMDDETEKLLRTLSRNNDLILFSVRDPMSHELPKDLDLILSDGVLQAQVHTGNSTQRQRLLDFSTGRLERLLSFATKFGIPVVPLSAAEETLPQMLSLLGGMRGQK